MTKLVASIALTGMLTLISMPAFRADGAIAEADLSSPAKALSCFRTALEAGETSDLNAVSIGDAKLRDWASAEAGQLKSLKQLEKALATRYGENLAASDKGKEALDRIADAKDDDLRMALAHARLLDPKGDEVVLELDPAAPDDHQGRLVRDHGLWKVDLASLSDLMAPDDVPVMKAVASAAAALAGDVAAGKFAEIDDADDAIGERLSAAIDEAMRGREPATRESPHSVGPRKAGRP